MIDSFTVNRIKSSIRIVDVVGDYISLRRAGQRYSALCPFHDDHRIGNFVVYPKKNCYKCFSCGAKGDGIKFLMDYAHMTYEDALMWLARKYSIFVEERKAEPLPLVTFPMKWVIDRQHTDNDNLVAWLKSLPWDAAQRSRIKEVLDEYHVGHSTIGRHEFTLFWQIDEQQRVRTAHYMKYNTNGRRVKKEQERYNTDWFHSLLSRPVKKDGVDTYPYRKYFDPDKQQQEQCLFGLHLLDKYPDATVNIVESEKTALIMAIAWGNNPMNVWMASCGEQNLTRAKLYPIFKRKRKVYLYPDRDGIGKWKDILNTLNYFDVEIEDKAVEEWWKPEDGDKADIADVVVRIVREGSKEQIESISENPYVRELTDKLELETYE